MSGKSMYNFGLQTTVSGLFAINYSTSNQNGADNSGSEIKMGPSMSLTLGMSEDASEPAKAGKKKGKKSLA